MYIVHSNASGVMKHSHDLSFEVNSPPLLQVDQGSKSDNIKCDAFDNAVQCNQCYSEV